MKIIICSVGTSILKDADTKLPLQKVIEKRIGNLDMSSDEGRTEASAEINSLNKIHICPSDRIFLLSTDTEDGYLCAQMLKKIISTTFNIDHGNIEILKIQGLQVNNAELFRKDGIKNLCSELMNLKERYAGREIILNPTGGFKGVVPFLAVFGMIFSMKTVYVFERSSQLISLPPLPVIFNIDIFLRARNALEFANENEIHEDVFLNNVEGYHESERELFLSLIEYLDYNRRIVVISSLAYAFHKINENTKGNVYLEPNVLKEFNKNKEYHDCLQRIILKICYPLWRTSHIHSFSGTDLTVIKPGSTPDRCACLVKGNDIFICLYELNHNVYEKKFPNYSKADFLSGLGAFTKISPDIK